jgi:hypothetical protein
MTTNNAGDWFPPKYGTGIPDTNPVLPRYMGLDVGGPEMINPNYPCLITPLPVNDWFVVSCKYTSFAFRLSEVALWQTHHFDKYTGQSGVKVKMKTGEEFLLCDEKGHKEHKVTDKQREFFARLGIPCPFETNKES